MPELPDFDQIARRIAKLRAKLEDADLATVVVEQLCLIWNARGAADIAKLEWAFAADDGEPAPSMKTLDRLLRTLDR